MAAVKDVVIRTESIFEMREVAYRFAGSVLAGFVVWDTNAGQSVGPGMVPTLPEAEILWDIALGSERAQRLTEARKVGNLPPTRVTGWC